MDSSNDPGGRSGVFPRIDPRPPVPAQADTPAPPRGPLVSDPDSLNGEALPAPEGEDLARYDDDTNPADHDPEDEAS